MKMSDRKNHSCGIFYGCVALLVLVVGAHGARQVGRADVRNYGAVGDGEQDDTQAIQRAVNAEKGEVYLPRGNYRISDSVVIDLSQVGPMSVEGNGTARIVMEGAGPAFRFIGTHDGTANPDTVDSLVWKRERMPLVQGIEIVGSHPEAVGIQLNGTMQAVISRVNIRNALHGIHLTERNRNVIISDCHIYENRGVGIYYDDVNLHQSNITGSHISYNGKGGIVVRAGNVRNIHVGTCDIEGNMAEDGEPTANILLDARGGSIGEVSVTGCTIQHTHNAPESANVRIIAKSNERPFTSERRHGNFVVADNVLSDCRYNVDIQNARAVTVTGNTFWMGYDRDIRVQNSAHIVVNDNVFDRNPRYHYGDGNEANHGALFTDCDGVTFSGNQIRGTGDVMAACILRRCGRSNITGCTILDYQKRGLLLEEVTHSRVSDCLIRDDRENGGTTVPIEVKGGSGNLITDNLFEGEVDREEVNAEK